MIIDNSTPGFDKKLLKVLDVVNKFVGEPMPETLFKKFLLRSVGSFPVGLKTEKFEIEEIFLKSDNNNRNLRLKIKKRG